MTERSIVLWFAAALTLAIIIALSGTALAGASRSSDLGFELAKGGIQLAVGVIMGGVATYVLRAFDDARDQRRRVNEYKITVLRTITDSYHTFKSVRRVMRTLGLSNPVRCGLTREDVEEFRAQMKALNKAQLDLERVARELKVHSDVFDENENLIEKVGTVERYVGGVVEDWEHQGYTIIEGAKPPLLDSMTCLRTFLAPADDQSLKVRGFKESASRPMESLEAMIRLQLLPSKLAAPPLGK